MKSSAKSKLTGFIKSNTAGVAFVAIVIVASIIYPKFMTYKNIYNVLLQQSIIGVIAVGVTFTILVKGIDLSVSSITVLAAILAATSDMNGAPLIVSILIPLAAGLACGLLNGFLISRLDIPAFIATLATMLSIKGLAFLIHTTSPTDMLKQSPEFTSFADASLIGLPAFCVVFIVVCLVCAVFLRFSSVGRRVYAVGGNADAANMMGLGVRNIRLLAFAISGFLSGLAGMMLASRIGLPQASATSGWEMNAIAAVVLGGTLLTGGVGKISGTFFGVMIVGIISNIINLQGNLMSWIASIVTGIVLLCVMIFQALAVRNNRQLI